MGPSEVDIVAGGDDDEDDELSEVELNGWILYDFANSVFSSVGLVLFLPLLVSGLAEEHAWNELDLEQPEACDESQGITSSCLSCVPGKGGVFVPGVNGTGLQSVPNARVTFAGSQLDPIAIASTALSVSVILQVLVFVGLGPLGDHGTWRRTLIGVFCAVGGVASCLTMAAGTPALWWFAALCLVVGNVAFGASIVFYNGYLPLLVDADPTVRQAKQSLSEDEYMEVRDEMENRFSMFGFGAGYVSGTFLLLVCVGLYFAFPWDFATLARVSCLIAGLWWLGFGGISVSRLRERPGPPLPEGSSYATYGFAQVVRTVAGLHDFPQTALFLVLFFVYSDGYTTISSVAIFFAQRDLCASTTTLLAVAIEVPFFAAVGNWAFHKLHQGSGWETKTMLTLNLAILAVLPVWGILGFFTDAVGFQNEWELFVFGAIYGLCLGAVQSYSRTIMADLCPRGKESQLFSLYEITDKGSSWLGPLVTAAIVQATDSLRLVFIYLLAVMVIPISVLWFFLDHKAGTLAAKHHVGGNGDKLGREGEWGSSGEGGVLVDDVAGRRRADAERRRRGAVGLPPPPRRHGDWPPPPHNPAVHSNGSLVT